MSTPGVSAAPESQTAQDPVARRGADHLVGALIDAGVKRVFGVPGDTGVVLYDALADRADDIGHVLARDERHAAAMADAYARTSNRVGVVEVSSGGGVTYVVGGLGEAMAAGTPVLVLTSDIHTASRGTGALTEIDQRALFSAVTKKVLVPETAAAIRGAVSEALELAASGRPGPVAIVVPEDVLDGLAPQAPSDRAGSDRVPAARAAAEAAAVGTAAKALAVAERPALLVGGGVHYSAAYDEVAELAEALGAGVATSIHGKGAVASGNPWLLGVTGNNGGNPLSGAHLAAADVVVVVGSRANATDTDSSVAPPRTAQVIDVDVDTGTVQRSYPHVVPLAGDAKTVLRQLLDALERPSAETIEQRRTQLQARRAARPVPEPVATPAGTLLVDDVADVLQELAAETGAIVVGDPGAPTPAIADRFAAADAGRCYVIPRGHGPMGYAIPAAVGVAMAAPERPVIALTADGSFAMSCGELETINRLQLPILLVQLTNHSLGWIKMLQHLYQGERYFGVDPGPIDAVAVARACGLLAGRPTTLEALREQAGEALRTRTARYLDVEVPHMIDVVPQVPAWHRALEGDRTRPAY